MINALSLLVTLHKVKAHSGNFANEKVDNLAKAALTSAALHFTINDQLHTTIKFNNYTIASPIRPFIKECIRTHTVTSFMNLDVNSNYCLAEVDWLTTAYCISDNISSSATSYDASSTKRKKLQRLLEMLPTLEVLKK